MDFALKVIQFDANTVVKLQLWDIAGQERYAHMTRVLKARTPRVTTCRYIIEEQLVQL